MGRATCSRPRREAGVRRFVLMSALGTTEETKDLVPYYGAKWQMEQDTKASGLEHVIFRPSHLRRPGGALEPVQADREAGAGDPDRRAWDAADPADLGRRRGGVLRRGGSEKPVAANRYVRARRPRYGHVERVLVAAGAGAGPAAQSPLPFGLMRGPGGGAGEAAGRRDTRPAEDARSRRQRRLEHDAADTFAFHLSPRRTTAPRQSASGGPDRKPGIGTISRVGS